MAGQNVSGWSQDALGVWHEDEVAAESEVTGVSDVAEWRDRQGSGAEAHGYALPSAIGMPISGLPRTDLDDLDDPAALALVVPEVVVPEHATCLGALLNGGMSCSPHFVPGKVHFQNNEVLTLTLTLALTLTLTLILILTLWDPNSNKVHFQNKFCGNCRSTVFLVPLARVRAVGAEQASHHALHRTIVHCIWMVYYIVHLNEWPIVHTSEQAECFVNNRRNGFWNQATASMGGGQYRIINNARDCFGPRLALFRNQPPQLPWSVPSETEEIEPSPPDRSSPHRQIDPALTPR
jgi:hypothetical protein